MARPTKEEARDTRRLILDAALELFAEAGFSGASMRELARRVGVRESALYHHFESKAAIFGALLGELGPGKLQRFAESDVAALRPAEFEPFLRSIARTLMEEAARPRELTFTRLLMAEGPRLKDTGVLHEVMLPGHAHLARFFAELERRGVVRPGDPELYAVEFLGPLMMLRLSYLLLAEGDRERLHALVDGHVRHFCESVKVREEPR